MNRIIKALRGTVTVRLCGGNTEELLNRMTEHQILYRDVSSDSERGITLYLLQRDLEKLRRLALQCFCELLLVKERGLPRLLRPLKRRPVLFLGMLAALAASFFLQSYVWTVTVSGNERVHEEQIVRALEARGVHFGTNASKLDTQRLKMQLLNDLPQLSWLAVNRTGGKLNVLVTERSEETQAVKDAPCNLVAASDGVITDYVILEGMRMCNRGDTVQEGQVLVSGYEDYGLYLRAVHANGEIYARTWRSGSLLMPKQRQEKHYTGVEYRQIFLLAGRKRIKLFGNSGISYTGCDKMVSITRLSLPGYDFPLAVETVTYREYRTVSTQRPAEVAQSVLQDAWQHRLSEQMIAGTVEKTEAEFSEAAEFYVYRAKSTCNEMIARLVPIAQPYEGETNE